MKIQELISEARQLPQQTRKDFLSNYCTNVTSGQYFKRFDSEDQIEQERNLSQTSIQLSLLEEQFEQVKAEWKTKIKEKKAELKNSLTLLRQNGEWVEGEQFMFADQVRGIMEVYDSNAEFIMSRRLLPEERQTTIFDGKLSAGGTVTFSPEVKNEGGM